MSAKNVIVTILLHLFIINFSKTSADVDVDSVKIIFYYGPRYNDFQEFQLSKLTSVLQHPKFIHNQTTCYMPAYKNKKDGADTRLMVHSYLKRNTTNFLKLDWEKLAQGSYYSAQQNILEFSPKVADSIIELFNAGLDEDSFSLSGLSMGARGIAVIGRDVSVRSNGTMLISRISPLDPSNEEAHNKFILPPIDKSFAKFVDIIHTDAGGRGTSKSMGHANFWPNNGTALQPGCSDNEIDFPLTSLICDRDNLLTIINGFGNYCYKKVCSHAKALAYWAESVANPNSNTMLAFSSESYDNLLENGSENYMETAVLMGIDCPSSARGDYYLQYNSSYGFT